MTSIFNPPLVSIVIPNWNGKNILKTCLQSLTNLTYPNYEIIVIDNASIDGSPDMVKKKFPQVKLVINEKNFGFARGCNVGIKLARGEMVALFNNDAVAEPSWLTELVKPIASSSDAGIAHGVIFHYEPKDIIWFAGGRIDVVTGNMWRIGYGSPLNQLGKVEDIDFVCGCALLIKKEVIEKIGLLDEGYSLYGAEDMDWSLKTKRAGYKLVFSPSAIVWHKASYTRRKMPLRSYHFYTRGVFRLYFKHFPLKYLFTALFFQLFVIPIFEVLLFRRHISFVIERIKGFFWNLLRLRELISERQKIGHLGKGAPKSRIREFLSIAKGAKASGRMPLA